jgi:mono/diheme cytochrome c family protein
MPAYGNDNVLTQQQIADVIAYVISLNNTPGMTPTPGPEAAINLTGDATAGLAVYTAQCEKCHGTSGAKGVDNPGSTDGTVPVLNPIDPAMASTDVKTFATNIDPFLQNGSTPEGSSPKLLMPDYGKEGILTQQQIADVEAYIIGLNNVPGPGDAINLSGNTATGLMVYTAQCVKCHGVSGLQGVDNPGSTDGTVPVLNPIDPEIKNVDPKIYITNLDMFLQNGSTPEGPNPKLLMPAYGKDAVITQQQIADVIAYLISLNK